MNGGTSDPTGSASPRAAGSSAGSRVTRAEECKRGRRRCRAGRKRERRKGQSSGGRWAVRDVPGIPDTRNSRKPPGARIRFFRYFEFFRFSRCLLCFGKARGLISSSFGSVRSMKNGETGYWCFSILTLCVIRLVYTYIDSPADSRDSTINIHDIE